MRLLFSSIAVVLFIGTIRPAARAAPVDVVKTNPMKVYMHYMPWFETPATLGGTNWGYHWKFENRNPNIVDSNGRRQIASHYYPKIGPYDSRDADVIEYHLLLMKYAGVDGVLIDWYGSQGVNPDVGSLLTNSNAVVNRVDDVGLKFGVVLEDRFSLVGNFNGPPDINKAKANVAYLRDNYFNKPQYIRYGAGQDPLLLVFGPIVFQQPSDWTTILGQAGEDVEFLTLWFEANEAGANANGEYAWIYQDPGFDNHLDNQAYFYDVRSDEIGTAGGVAYPGFNDYYEEGGVGQVVPFTIPHNNGQTLDAVLDQVSAKAADMQFLQLATFNDFGEGTMFEPTVETDYEYLKRVQEYTGVPYGEKELKLVHRLYNARKEYASSSTRQAQLTQVATLLSELKLNEARTLLETAAPAGDFDGDGDVDRNDYNAWKTAFGTTRILAGTGADGNYDGKVNAADYVVWRNSRGGLSGNGLGGSVPEPTTAGLVLVSFLVGACRLGRIRWTRPDFAG